MIEDNFEMIVSKPIDTRIENIHDMFVDMLIDDLKVAKETGIPMPTGDKAIIATFLKNNRIPENAAPQELREYSLDMRQQLANKRQEMADKILSRAKDADLDDLV